jgi:gamma-glutamylcyclotransferase (GGCT)/AIG2-like uncharacterized protein YtfP
MATSLPELDTDLLFVYGTLRRGLRLHHHLKRLGAAFVATGKVKAELVDLGEFPGARKSTKPGKIVKGEVYRLRRVVSALKVLDQVEGFSPRARVRSMFQRAMTEVTLPNGERRTAWIYWLNKWACGRKRGARFD